MSVRFLEDLNVDGNLDSGQLSVNHNAGALNMVGTDHTYMQWYPAGLSGGRHAYTGFAGGGTNHFTIANETSGANINLATNSGTVNVTGNLSVSGTIDGVDIGANYANWNTAYGWGNHASAGYLLKSGGTMTGTLQAATLEGASFTNRFRKMSVLPGGYIEPNALNFRFDESQTAYAGEAHGIGGTISQTSGTTIPDASLKRLFTFTSSYINLNTYKDASNNVVVELTNIALSNSANTSWRPYVFFHSAASSVASMTIELKDGDNNWETVENAIDCVDFYMYDGFYTLSPGILRGARFTFTNITGNSYLRMIGVIGKTVEPYQWNVLKSGSKMFGDLDFADSKKATFGNSGDLDLLHDGSNSYIHHNGAGSLYMKADTGDINIINYTNDRDITLQSDNGSGGTTPYITLDGSVVETKFNKDLRVIDNEKIIVGNSNDLEIFSSGASVHFRSWSGDMTFQQNANDKDIIFQSDDGSGGTTAYLTLDGSTTHSYFSAGNVGIGTSSPQADLQVGSVTTSFYSLSTGKADFIDTDKVLSETQMGTLNVTSNSRSVGDNSDLGPSITFSQNVSQYVDGYEKVIGGIKSYITTSGNTGENSSLGFYTHSGSSLSEKVTINSSGNVGIGTTSPGYKLDVAGTAKIQAATSAYLTFEQSSNQYQAAINSSNHLVLQAAFNNQVIFKDGGATNMVIDGTTSNVGIGTTSPSRQLEVSNTGDAIIRIAGDSDNDAGEVGDAVLELTTDQGSHGYSIRSENIGGGTGYFKINTFIGGTESTKLLINRDGEVGIGTTSPGEKLDVAGNAIINGDLTVTSGTSGDATLIISADTDNSEEGDSPRLWFKADGDITQGAIQHNDNTFDFISNVSANGGFRFLTGTTNNTGTTDPSNGATERVSIDSTGMTISGSIQLGHASDTTIARASAGKVTIEGQPIQTKQMSMTHHNFFMNSTSTTTDFFVPFNNLNESSNPTNSIYYGRMVAPYDGRIVKVVLHTTAAIGTACQVLFWVATSSGVFAPSAAETVTGVNLNTANTSATATFSTTSTAEFDEGDVLGVSIIKSSSATANMQVTVVWEYTV